MQFWRSAAVSVRRIVASPRSCSKPAFPDLLSGLTISVTIRAALYSLVTAVRSRCMH